MPICASCKNEVSDIRPQIEGVGICFDCAEKSEPIPQDAIEKWKKLREIE